MSRTAKIVLAALILAIAGGAYFWLQNRKVLQPALTSFNVQKPNFVAEGRDLGRVEIWAIPTGTNIAPADYVKIGDARKTGSDDDKEVWTLPIPAEPMLATQIYAAGYSANGEEAGRIFLPYTGATDVYDAIWGNSSSTAEQVPPLDCGGCVGERDNGRTLNVPETSRITIELPTAKYIKSSVTITPRLMGETFGASSAPGYWVRTFEAVQPGTAVIHVSSTQSSIPPYVLTINITGPQ